MMNYEQLVREAALLLDEYKADKHCVEIFIQEGSKSLKDLEAAEQEFVLDMVSGCIEHKKLLDVVVNVFYIHNGKCFLKADRNQFAVICYLAAFLLGDLGLQGFSEIVRCMDTAKMHKFLSFFFNVTNLSTWILGEWSQIYDAPYVEKNWIGPLLRWQPEMEVLIDKLARRMAHGSLPKKTAKKYTEPKEFDLTKPKARPLPMPEPIPQQEKHPQVPASTYRPPKVTAVLERVKQTNRRKAQKVLLEANTQQFRCANPKKSERTKNVVSQIVQERQAQLQFNKLYSSRTPATQQPDNPLIRLNTTAILREAALYNRQVKEQLQRVEGLAKGAGEPSSFLQWQKEMREQGLQEELARVERRHLEGLISHEEAVLARVRIMERNQKRALLKKEETAQLMRRYADKLLKEGNKMRELVQQVAEGHKNAKLAKVQLQDYKQRIVQEVSEQNREYMRQALEEAQAELSKKFDLIRQIRAIQSVHFIPHKFVDETETAGHALLGEMSLAELRERLALLRKAELREQEERRERILLEKQGREQLLREQLDNITLHRTELAHAATRRQLEKRARLGQQRGVAEDVQVVELKRKLEERKQQRQTGRQADRAKSRACDQAVPQAHCSWSHRKKLEEHHWKDLENSLQRQVQQESRASLSLRRPVLL